MKYLLIALMLFANTALFALEQGDTVTELQLQQFGGDQPIVSIATPSEGKSFVILEFMSMYCGPCIRSLPFLGFLYNGVKENADLRVITIDAPSAALDQFFAGYYSTNFDLPFIGDDNQESAAIAYDIEATPTLFVVDSEGTVVYKHVGTISFGESGIISSIINQ